VINRARLKNHECCGDPVGADLNGWTEEQCNDSMQMLKEKLDEARKDIKAEVHRPPQEGRKGFNIVIPDSSR